MWESFFGFKKTPFSDSPDGKQLFASQAWNQVKSRLEFLAQHHGVGLVRADNVVEVVAATGQEAPILDPADRLADAELLHRNSPRPVPCST